MQTNPAPQAAPSAPLTIIAHVRAKPGTQARLLAAQVGLVAAARQHRGCLRYELHQSNTEEGFVIFVEQWASAAQWRDHMESPYMNAFRSAAGDCIGEFSLYEMHAAA